MGQGNEIYRKGEESIDDLIKGTISYKDGEGNVETIGAKNHVAEEKDKAGGSKEDNSKSTLAPTP
jgi:hypothetical protein